MPTPAFVEISNKSLTACNVVPTGDAALAINNNFASIDALFNLVLGQNAMRPRGNWLTATGYAFGDVVLNGGVFYQAITAHTSSGTNTPPNAAFWKIATNLPNPNGYLGVIYNKTSFANLNDFTLNQTATGTNAISVAATSGAVAFTYATTGGNATNFYSTLDLTPGGVSYYTDLYKWTISAVFTVGTFSSTSFGMGIGLRSTNTQTNGDYRVVGRVAFDTVNNGRVFINAGTCPVGSGGVPGVDQSIQQATVVSSGDVIQLILERDNDLYTVTAVNITRQTAPATVSYRPSWGDGATVTQPNISKFSIYTFGGNHTMNSLSVSSKEITNAEMCCVGDSKVVGLYGGNFHQVYSSLLQNTYTSITLAGGNEVTQDVLNRLPEIISLAPKNVLLSIGRNDIFYSISTGTWQANLASIVTQLTNAGINVVHILPLYESGGSMGIQSTLTSYITTNYTQYINPLASEYGTGSSPAYTPAGLTAITDGIHPNGVYHNLVYRAIVAYFAGTQYPRFQSVREASLPIRLYANTYNQLTFLTNTTTILAQVNVATQRTIQVNLWFNITSMTGTNVISSVTFKDENNASQTLNPFFINGTTGTMGGVAAYYSLIPLTFRTNANTTITVQSVFTGSSIVYDAGVTITQLD